MQRKVSTGKKKKRVSGTVGKVSHRRRRRRVGAMDDAGKKAEQYLAVGAGAIAGREGAVMLGSVFPSLQASPLMVGLGEIAIAFFLPKFVKGPFIENMALGLAANGVVTAVVATGIITGPMQQGNRAYQIGGTAGLPVVNGVSNLRVINGPNTRISNVPNNVYTGPAVVKTAAVRRYNPYM